jgi:hypothetical protein
MAKNQINDHLSEIISTINDNQQQNAQQQIENFNSNYEKCFCFTPLEERVKIGLVKCIIKSFQLATTISTTTNEDDTTIINNKCSWFDLIRLISRDPNAIDIFANDQLLEIIQNHADLNMNLSSFVTNSDETEDAIDTNLDDLQLYTKKKNSINIEFIPKNKKFEPVVLAAMKCMSNLIYNSKYIREYFDNHGVAETITAYLMQFQSIEETTTTTTTPITDFICQSFTVRLFHLKILFLLTTFNKDMRKVLKEKFQILTYLIEIIDKIVKDRFNEIETTFQSNSHSLIITSPGGGN